MNEKRQNIIKWEVELQRSQRGRIVGRELVEVETGKRKLLLRYLPEQGSRQSPVYIYLMPSAISGLKEMLRRFEDNERLVIPEAEDE